VKGATELDRWVTAWLGRQKGAHWPKVPQHHTRKGDRCWSGGAPWAYSGHVWTVELALVNHGLAGNAWALGLLHCVPAHHMPLATRDLGDRWVVQLVVDGRQVRVVDDHPGLAVGAALREAYATGPD